MEGKRDEDSIPALKELSTLSPIRYHLYFKHSHRMFSFISQADSLSSPCYIPQMPVRHFHLDVLFKSKIQHGENKHLPQQICSSSYVPSVSFQEPELKKTLSERVQMQKRFKLGKKNTKQKFCLWSWGTKYAREKSFWSF